MNKLILAFILLSFSHTSFSAVSYSEFQRLEKAVLQAFEELKNSNDEALQINPVLENMAKTFWWDLDAIRASYVRVEDEGMTFHNIYLMGGYARLHGMSVDGLALTACHEIGHGLAKGPKKDPTVLSPIPSAQEGEADYYATSVCLPVVFKYLKQSSKPKYNRTVESFCRRQVKHTTNVCKRMFEALKSDIYYFSLGREYSSIEDYDSTIATELNSEPTFYPSAQCRIDTMIHGIFDLERPECWYPGGEKNGTLRD